MSTNPKRDSWIERRAREDFRKLVGETDKQVIAAAIAKAEEHVKLLQRSSAVYSMYAPKHATILVSSLTHVQGNALTTSIPSFPQTLMPSLVYLQNVPKDK